MGSTANAATIGVESPIRVSQGDYLPKFVLRFNPVIGGAIDNRTVDIEATSPSGLAFLLGGLNTTTEIFHPRLIVAGNDGWQSCFVLTPIPMEPATP